MVYMMLHNVTLFVVTLRLLVYIKSSRMQEDLSTTGSIAAFVLTIFLSTALRSKPMLGTTPIPSDMLVWEELQWETKIFSELSTIELYQIMTLREQVFVVEVKFFHCISERFGLTLMLKLMLILYISLAKLPLLRL